MNNEGGCQLWGEGQVGELKEVASSYMYRWGCATSSVSKVSVSKAKKRDNRTDGLWVRLMWELVLHIYTYLVSKLYMLVSCKKHPIFYYMVCHR